MCLWVLDSRKVQNHVPVALVIAFTLNAIQDYAFLSLALMKNYERN